MSPIKNGVVASPIQQKMFKWQKKLAFAKNNEQT